MTSNRSHLTEVEMESLALLVRAVHIVDGAYPIK
jgi:hypothetical protein